jgi:hypothetical protein
VQGPAALAVADSASAATVGTSNRRTIMGRLQ